MECMELKICMSDKHHRYYKHTKFRQNPRGDPKFLVDLTRNDPYSTWVTHLQAYMENVGMLCECIYMGPCDFRLWVG